MIEGDRTRPRRFGARSARLLVLSPLVVGASLALPAVGAAEATRYLGEALGTALLQLVLIAPLVLLALWRSKSRRQGPLLLAAALFALSVAVTLLPYIPFVRVLELTWNWQGKILDVSWALLFVLIWRLTPAQVGLGRLEPGSLRPVLVVAGLLGALFAVPGFFRGVPTPEEALYQLTMPSLSEELVFRGVLLALLNETFGRPWRLAGAPVGWGLIITSLLFGLGHGAAVTGAVVTFQPLPIVLTGLLGAALGWLRERSGSLWPAVLTHSLINSAEFVVPLLKLFF